MLSVLDTLPIGFLETSARDLCRVLNGPTLMHLPGRRAEPLFVAVLLHGNETTGLEAVQQVLHRHEGKDLPRALSLFVGNVAAARAGVRRLDDQPDFNRIWLDGEEADASANGLARAVMAATERHRPFAVIDVHNNTGVNPRYACVQEMDIPSLHLATLFSRTVVYFTRPRGVLIGATRRIAPSVVLECGKAGDPGHVRAAADYIDACLHLADIPKHPVSPHDIDLYHTVGTVKIPEHIRFGFGKQEADLVFDAGLEQRNFRDLPVGISFGRVTRHTAVPLDVFDESGGRVTDRYFILENDEIRTRVPVMPAMLTCDERAIRLDCLCYLMERIAPPSG